MLNKKGVIYVELPWAGEDTDAEKIVKREEFYLDHNF